MTRRKVMIYAKDDRFRTITYFPATNSIRRSYGKGGSGQPIAAWARRIGIAEAALILAAYGREQWVYDVEVESVETLGRKFAKSAEKAGFERVGTVILEH